MIELAAESAPGRQKIGTTSRGIGPAYEDKMARNGLRVVDLLNPNLLKTHIENACHEKNTIAHALFGTDPLDPAKMYDEYAARRRTGRALRHRHRPICSTKPDQGGSVMFEGAQGTMLDIDHGTYPFVTSSSATAGGAATGTGVGPTAIGTVIGVTKAYVTRVGEGPFPTEIHDESGELLRARGQEYGAVTGRPRRCGWLDIPLLRYSNQVNGAEWLVVTKLDVLDALDEIPVCIGYEIDGKLTDEHSRRRARHRVHRTRLHQTEGLAANPPKASPNSTSCRRSRRTTCASSGTGNRRKNRHDLHRPRPRPDHAPARIRSSLKRAAQLN